MSHSTSDLLEICLNRVAAGLPIDEAVAPYPERAAELRELLQVALAAMPPQGGIRVPASAQVDSRRRLLAQAQQLQQQRGSEHWWSLLSFLRGNAGSLGFGLAVLLLFFLAINSVRALPGDSLYPVKLAAEQASVSLPGSSTTREQRVISFENQRTEEVAQMIQLGRTGSVDFGGFLQRSQEGSGWHIDGIPLDLAQALNQQAAGLTGARVEIKGFLGEQGRVQVETLQPRLDTLEGTLTRLAPDTWVVNGQEVRVTELTQVSGTPRQGSQVSAQVAALKDTSAVLAIRAEVAPAVVKETPTAPAKTTATGAAQPVNPQKLQATSEPEDSATSTLAPGQDYKSRPITQPALNATPTPGDSNSEGGQNTQPAHPSEDHHDGSDGGDSGSKDGEH